MRRFQYTWKALAYHEKKDLPYPDDWPDELPLFIHANVEKINGGTSEPSGYEVDIILAVCEKTGKSWLDEVREDSSVEDYIAQQEAEGGL